MRYKEYPLIYLIMPRVVVDQRHKFDTDDLFVRLSHLSEMRYSGYLIGTEMERRAKFLQDCHEGKLDITFLPSGFNLELRIAQAQEAAEVSTDFVDISSEPPKVHICTHFILNGVCVRWRGWIDRNTLHGQGRLEFDVMRAQVEHQRLQQELRSMQERLQGVPQAEPPELATAVTAAPTPQTSETPTTTVAVTTPVTT